MKSLTPNVVTIFHDPFGRVSVVRRLIRTDECDCDYCGRPNGRGRLFQYGVERDDNGRTTWDNEIFCSITCRRDYYQ